VHTIGSGLTFKLKYGNFTSGGRNRVIVLAQFSILELFSELFARDPV
jgi:hypothetical protein